MLVVPGMPFVDRVLPAVSCLDALEGSGLSCSRILFLVCKEKNQLWAVLEPGAHHPVPLQQNLHLCFAGMCPWGPGLAAPVPAHHTQPSVDPMGGLELRVGCSAPEHNNTGHGIFPSSCTNPAPLE